MKERGFAEIGKRLLSVRGDMDQRGFARHVNVSQQAISNYERGNLPNSWSFLRKLNEDFNVNVNWLLTGHGQRDHRAGNPFAALADNRPPGWPRVFLDQVFFGEGDRLDLLLHLYFFYLATEPADVKARLMTDLQSVIDAVRSGMEREVADEADRQVLGEVYDALARDDRTHVVAALLRLGERYEASEDRRTLAKPRQIYLAALAVARQQQWPEREVEAGRRVGRTYRKEGRYAEAERTFSEVVALAEREEESPPDVSETTWARVWLGYGHVAKEQGDVSEARRRYTRALEWALRTAIPDVRAEVYLDLGCLAFHEHEWLKALELLGTGRAFAEQGGDARLIADFKLSEALILRERGELETAEAILKVVLAQAEREGDPRIVAVASGNLAEVLADRGEGTAAKELLERTADTAESHAGPRSLALRKLIGARLAAAKGEDEAARALAVESLRIAQTYGLKRELDQTLDFLQGAAGVPAPEMSAG